MKNNFDYWVSYAGKAFLVIYWIQFLSIYFLAISLAVKTKNPFVFLFLGFCPYLVILAYLRIRSPFNTLKDGIKKYDGALYERLSRKIPEKYSKHEKKAAASLFFFLSDEPEATLHPDIICFKKNYGKITNMATVSLSLWFITLVVLGIYLFIMT